MQAQLGWLACSSKVDFLLICAHSQMPIVCVVGSKKRALLFVGWRGGWIWTNMQRAKSTLLKRDIWIVSW